MEGKDKKTLANLFASEGGAGQWTTNHQAQAAGFQQAVKELTASLQDPQELVNQIRANGQFLLDLANLAEAALCEEGGDDAADEAAEDKPAEDQGEKPKE